MPGRLRTAGSLLAVVAAVVFAVDDPARVAGAYWGGYGLAQAGLAALVGMLQAELGDAPVRVTGLVPPPMRYWLAKRAKSGFEGKPSTWSNGLGAQE